MLLELGNNSIAAIGETDLNNFDRLEVLVMSDCNLTASAVNDFGDQAHFSHLFFINIEHLFSNSKQVIAARFVSWFSY